jgi:predicted aminopeptidase
MPFFYFDIKNDEQLTEDEGFELPSLQDAKAEAVAYLAEAAKSHLKLDADRQEIVCTVKNDRKKPLLRARLALEIAHLHKPDEK